MKKFDVLGSFVVIAILIVLAGRVLSQKNTGKVDAFHASLKKESAKDYQSAIQSLLAGYKEYKNDYLVNLRLGWLYYNVQNYSESRKYYTEAVTLARNSSVEALLARTLPLSALNDWDGVRTSYAEVLKLDPMNYTANLRLGQILMNKGSYSEAKGYLEKAQTNYPGEYEPNLSLGWTYYYLGNREKAVTLLTNALMLSPGDTLATQGLNLLR